MQNNVEVAVPFEPIELPECRHVAGCDPRLGSDRGSLKTEAL